MEIVLAWLLGSLCAAASIGTTADDPLLVVHGAPYATGTVTIGIAHQGSEGQAVWLGLGIDPLPLAAPIPTGKGPFWIGTLLTILPLGPLPAGVPLEIPVVLPDVIPGAEGLPIVAQVLVGSRLSNAAVVPLDPPYFLPTDAQVLLPASPQTGGHFGAVTGVGDFDGDGLPDLVVGELAWSGPFNDQGRVHLFWGPDLSVETTLQSPKPGKLRYFGLGLAAADLDGDGDDELIVGEGSGYPDPLGDTGRLWIHGMGRGFAGTPLEVPGTATGVEATIYGGRIAVGDYDADGQLDLAVGVESAIAQGLSKVGRIEVRWGPDFFSMLAIENPEGLAYDSFGTGLVAADVTGDGVADLVEASGRADHAGEVNIGRAHVFSGPGLALVATLENPLPDGFNSRFGSDMTAADLDADGVAEVLVSDERGHVFAFQAPDLASWQLIRQPPSPSGTNLSFGYFLAADDLNGDGHTDVCVGAPFVGDGVVYAYLGPHFGAALTLTDPQQSADGAYAYGLRLADLDLDGRPELLVGNDLGTGGPVPFSGKLVMLDGDF